MFSHSKWGKVIKFRTCIHKHTSVYTVRKYVLGGRSAVQIRHLPKQSGCADLPPCCATAENGDFTTVQVETGIYNNLLGSNHNFSAHKTIYLIRIGYLLNLWVKCTGAGGQITLLKGVVSIIFIHNQKGLCSSQRFDTYTCSIFWHIATLAVLSSLLV